MFVVGNRQWEKVSDELMCVWGREIHDCGKQNPISNREVAQTATCSTNGGYLVAIRNSIQPGLVWGGLLAEGIGGVPGQSPWLPEGAP